MKHLMNPPCNGPWISRNSLGAVDKSKGWLRALVALLASTVLNLGLEGSISPGTEYPINVNFHDGEVNRFPVKWKARDPKGALKVYTVQDEAGKMFIRAESRGTKDPIGYEARWPLREFPVLQWQWRAILFPTGSNERERCRNDSVLGLYVIFGTWPFIKTIKYIWSDTLPAGSIFPSPYSSTTRIVVVRNGRELQGTWVSERRDVLADYFQIYGDKDKNPVATGIGLLTDSDDTNSQSIGDYAEFRTLPPDAMQAANP